MLKLSRAMRLSLVAAVVVVALSLLSMGLLGALLYFATYPVIVPLFGVVDSWSGDWVWGAMIRVAWLWALCFPIAAWIYDRLPADRYGKVIRRGV